MKHIFIALSFTCCVLITTTSYCQNSTANIVSYNGTLIAGYVDGGGYVNFTGPGIIITRAESRIIAGMLPSLRIKKDTAAESNSTVTPNLGFGITYSYKRLALQVPVYYNPKTATQNGKWNLGFGFGVRL